MSIKKDQLKSAMANMSQPTPKPFTGINPVSLDEQPTAQSEVVIPTKQGTVEAKPPRKNVKAVLPKRKWGKVNTSRYSFEITDELKEKLNKRLAEIQLTTGKKVSASEIIRQALARELRDL